MVKKIKTPKIAMLKTAVKSHLKKDIRGEHQEIADDKALMKEIGGYTKSRIKRPMPQRRSSRSR
jgi:hypothetical protein